MRSILSLLLVPRSVFFCSYTLPSHWVRFPSRRDFMSPEPFTVCICHTECGSASSLPLPCSGLTIRPCFRTVLDHSVIFFTFKTRITLSFGSPSNLCLIVEIMLTRILGLKPYNYWSSNISSMLSIEKPLSYEPL